MKIRMDFVTNSSSSSFVLYQIKSRELVELLDQMVEDGLLNQTYRGRCYGDGICGELVYSDDMVRVYVDAKNIPVSLSAYQDGNYEYKGIGYNKNEDAKYLYPYAVKGINEFTDFRLPDEKREKLERVVKKAYADNRIACGTCIDQTDGWDSNCDLLYPQKVAEEFSRKHNEITSNIDFDLPEEYKIFRNEDGSDKSIIEICAEQFYSDIGEPGYRFRCITEIQICPDIYVDTNNTERWLDDLVSEIDNCKILKLSGNLKTIIMSLKTPIKCEPQLNSYTITAMIQASDWEYVYLTAAGNCEEGKANVNSTFFAHFYAILCGLRIDEKKLSLGNLSAKEMEETLTPDFY